MKNTSKVRLMRYQIDQSSSNLRSHPDLKNHPRRNPTPGVATRLPNTNASSSPTFMVFFPLVLSGADPNVDQTTLAKQRGLSSHVAFEAFSLAVVNCRHAGFGEDNFCRPLSNYLLLFSSVQSLSHCLFISFCEARYDFARFYWLLPVSEDLATSTLADQLPKVTSSPQHGGAGAVNGKGREQC